MTGGISETEGSTDGVRAGSWGSFAKHWNPDNASERYRCEEGDNTDVDGPDPFRLLIGTERSPFSPYRWIRTGTRIIRTKRAYCRPKDGQSDREMFADKHIWARYRVNGVAAANLGSIYCLESYKAC